MTINEAIERQQRLRADETDDLTKAEWIITLDGQLWADFIPAHKLNSGETLPEPVKNFPEDGDKPLLIPPPWDNVYVSLLVAQTDYYNGETDRHANSAAVYNDDIDAWKRHFHREHMPVPSGGWKTM